MCGIAVAIDWDDAEGAVQRLIAGVLHRGDITDPVVSLSRGIAMGTRRLRIVDGEHAAQPQPSYDGRLLVSFNGEIYNHVELRREMEAMGVAFRTASDTEVLASSLRVWGARALERINGMYAFVAVDTRNGEFLAARDPLGVKPLYLIQSERGFLFCSEIRPLLNACEKDAVLFLPPGHMLTRKSLVKFGSMITFQAEPRLAHDPAALDARLANAVQIRIPPDLPFATMFSGGIDSTLIAHYARRERPETPGYFLGDERSPDYEYAARYADRTGFDLRRVALGDASEDMSARIDGVVSALESFEPSMIRDGYCNFLLARRIHEDGYRVALCGEGADELFAGYEPLELAFHDGETAGRAAREQTLAAMHKTNLQRLDRLGMRFQLELREPFLDPSVIGYALGLPANALLQRSGGDLLGKAPLRSLWTLHPDLPPEIRDRRKTAMHIGSGLDQSQKLSPWIEFAEQSVSDRDFADGKLRFAPFDLRTKEEYLYLDRLAASLDVSRVPHLTARPRLRLPPMKSLQEPRHVLSDYLV